MPAISFTVSRSGDLTKLGSVDWALSGSLQPADLAAGQATSGTLNWPANDANPRSVVINTKGNTTDNPDRTCTITLSNPVNATLGAFSATTTVLDDDAGTVTPGTDYIPDLAFGGIFLGAAVVDGAPGNTFIRRSMGPNNAVVMYLEHDDPIVAINCENRVDHFPLGTTAGGYSDKTVMRGNPPRPATNNDSDPSQVLARARGGDLRWRVAKVIAPADGVAGDIVLEKNANGSTRWAGQTPLIVACAKDASWNEQYRLSGGTGPAPPRFGASQNGGAYPTIWFETPIRPSDWGWKIGDRIAFCIQNENAADTGPGAGGDAMQRPYGNSEYMSLNNAHRVSRPLRKSTYRYLAYSGVFPQLQDTGAAGSRRYAPVLLVGHRGADGVMHVKGNTYQGDSDGDFGFTRVRQIIYIPNDNRWNGRQIIGFDAGVWRQTSGTGGSVTLELSRATPGSVGASGDDGTSLGSRTIAAANIEVGGGRAGSGTAFPQGDANMGLNDFLNGAVRTVRANEAYYLEVRTSGSGWAIGKQLNYIGRVTVGLQRADHQDSRNRMQIRGGGGWANTGGTGTDYNIFGIGMHLRA